MAVFSLTAGLAGAAVLTNADKTDTKVVVKIDGKRQDITLKSGETFDSKGKVVHFRIGKEKPVSAKGEEQLHIMGGKISALAPAAGETKADVATKEAVKTEATKPVEAAKDTVVKTITPAEKTVAVPVEEKK